MGLDQHLNRKIIIIKIDIFGFNAHLTFFIDHNFLLLSNLAYNLN